MYLLSAKAPSGDRELVAFSVIISGRLEMWRKQCFGTLSKFGVAVKSLSVEHCIQASEQGEEVTHLPS